MFKIEYHYSHRDPWLISFLLKTVHEIFLLLHVKLIELYRLISFRLKEEHKLDSLTRPAHLCYPRLTCLSPKLSTNEKKKKKSFKNSWYPRSQSRVHLGWYPNIESAELTLLPRKRHLWHIDDSPSPFSIPRPKWMMPLPARTNVRSIASNSVVRIHDKSTITASSISITLFTNS